MKFDVTKLFDSPSEFFKFGGSATMKLSARASYDFCQEASRRNFIIMRIEGGIWNDGCFEARFDCIWDGLDPPVTKDEAIENNNDAAEFIRIESTLVRHDSAPYNAFIFTARPISYRIL